MNATEVYSSHARKKEELDKNYSKKMMEIKLNSVEQQQKFK